MRFLPVLFAAAIVAVQAPAQEVRIAPPEAGLADAVLRAAQTQVRELREAGSVEVVLEPGIYRIGQPWRFSSGDGGTPGYAVTYRAGEGGPVVISGGIEVEGWVAGEGGWHAEIPPAAVPEDGFSALWINGERRTLARTPNAGEYYHTAGKATPEDVGELPEGQALGQSAFRYKEDHIQAWEGWRDAAVWVFHAWATSGHGIARILEDKQTVLFRSQAVWEFERWGPEQRYYIENIRAALDAPGEWFFDRAASRLYYIPLEGEAPGSVQAVLPRTPQLLVAEGTAQEPIANLHFHGITFAHGNGPEGQAGRLDAQSAYSVPGAVHFRHVRHGSVRDCTIAHTGTYGLWLDMGCLDNTVSGCEVYDLGAGGVRVGGMTRPTGDMQDAALAASRNRVENNFIHDGGHIFHSGVGVFITHANYTTVAHNDICDFYYSGISNGWVWGYGESPTHHNLIEYNHIHHLGKGVLSDMGGIYNLGRQPGTVLQNNHIHHIYAYHYGGWGLYTDEGSSEILLQNNVVHDTKSGNFDQHYGRNNRVRNNIFAFSKEHQLTLTRVEEHRSFIFEKNIVLSDNGKVFNAPWRKADIWTGRNLYWDTAGTPLDFGGLDFAAWQEQGQDRGSIVADPRFANAEARDFTLAPDSIAVRQLGFTPIDTRAIGLQGPPEWTAKPSQIQREPASYWE